MRLPLVCFIGFLFTFTSSESPRSYVADTRRAASPRPFNFSSPWRPQTRRYSRPHIQRVWLARDQNSTSKFRTNHTENIRSFAYAINDTSKFLRYLSEEESKLNLDKVITYDKSSNSTANQSSETEVDDSDYETLETSDGYDATFEDSQSMSDSSEMTTKVPSTTVVSRGRYRPIAIQLSNRLAHVPTTTKAPNISTYSPKRRYRTTTVKPYQTTPFESRNTTPFTVTPMILILNVTENSLTHSNDLRFPAERRSANTTVGEEGRNGNSYSQQVIHITPYSVERQQQNSINYRRLDKTGVDLTTEHSNFHSKMFPTYEQHPDYNDNSYIIKANQYQARAEKAEQVSQLLSDYRQTNANYTVHFHNRNFEPYDTVTERYTSYSSGAGGNNGVYNTTHTGPTSSSLQQYLHPKEESYANPYNIASSTDNSHVVFRNHVIHSPTPAKQIDDTYGELNNYSSHSTTTLRPAFWVRNESTSSFHNNDLRYNFSRQSKMLPDTYEPTSSSDYNSSSVSRQEHSVQIISMNDSSEYYQRDPVISYIEEPYTAYDRPSFFSRGISGTVPPTASDTKPLPSTIFPYPVEFIEAPYNSRRHNQRAYSRRKSKTARRRHRKHRKRGGQRRIGASSAFNGVISPSINLLPPFLPTVDDVYSYGNHRIQKHPVMSVMEGRRWKDYPSMSSTQPNLHRRVDSRHGHSNKRGSKVARTFDGHSSSRRHPVLEAGINMTATDYGELQLTPAESTYYKRRQVSMKEFLMKDVVEHQGSIPGVPGRDYPTYYMPPITNFSCLNLQGRRGYFADPSTRCQVFYICPGDGRGEPMLCPNGTVFNQLVFVCDWWFNVDCGTS